MLHTFGLSDGYRRWQLCRVICKMIGCGVARCILYLHAYNHIVWLGPEGSKDLHTPTHTHTHTHTHTQKERDVIHICTFLRFPLSLYIQQNFLSIYYFSHPSRNITAGNTTFLLDRFCLQEIRLGLEGNCSSEWW